MAPFTKRSDPDRSRNAPRTAAYALPQIRRLGELDRSKVRATFERDWSAARVARELDEVYRRYLAERGRLGLWGRLRRALMLGRR